MQERVKSILKEMPAGVQLVAAAKTRSALEVQAAFDAGIKIMGQNYLQDAQNVIGQVSDQISWHFIGAIQSRKVRQIVPLFDMIETVSSFKVASLIDREAQSCGKIMPILIQVNSGREEQKSGVCPEDAVTLVREIASLENVRIMGLMTMGPNVAAAEELRPYFRLTRELAESIAAENIPNVEMRHLSMGMSDSYRVAIEEGATLVRLGTAIFGPRDYR